MLLKYVQQMATPMNYVIARRPWHFRDFLNIFLPNAGEAKKVVPSERGAPGTVPYGKSGPGNCITFMKKVK